MSVLFSSDFEYKEGSMHYNFGMRPRTDQELAQHNAMAHIGQGVNDPAWRARHWYLFAGRNNGSPVPRQAADELPTRKLEINHHIPDNTPQAWGKFVVTLTTKEGKVYIGTGRSEAEADESAITRKNLGDRPQPGSTPPATDQKAEPAKAKPPYDPTDDPADD